MIKLIAGGIALIGFAYAALGLVKTDYGLALIGIVVMGLTWSAWGENEKNKDCCKK